MPTAKEIETQILDAYDLKGKASKEKMQDFYNRILDANEKVSDEQWEKLSLPAQDWINAAITATKEDRPIPAIVDAEPEPEQSRRGSTKSGGKGGKKGAEASSTKASGKGGGSKGGGKKADPEPEPERTRSASSKADRSGGGRAPAASAISSDGLKYRAKVELFRNPKLTVDELQKLLSKGGADSPTRLTCAAVRSETRHTIKVLKDLGALKDNKIEL